MQNRSGSQMGHHKHAKKKVGFACHTNRSGSKLGHDTHTTEIGQVKNWIVTKIRVQFCLGEQSGSIKC